MKWSDLKLMAIGGCCLSVFILKKDRIPGPVDNTLLFNVESIKLLLTNKYYSYIKHHTPIKTLKANRVPWEPDYNYEFPKIVRIVHNNIEEPKFMPELKKRVNNLNKFWETFSTDRTKFFIFSIPYSMINQDSGQLENRFLEEIIQYFKDLNILDRVIFVGCKKSNKVENNVWYDNYLLPNDLNYLKDKYNIKYLELTDVIITRKGLTEKEKLYIQFKQKLAKLLKLN